MYGIVHYVIFFNYDVPVFTMYVLKETKSATMNTFRKKIIFLMICKSRIKLSFHNKSVHYT